MRRVTLCLLFVGLVILSIPHLFAQAPDQATHAPGGGTQTTIVNIFVPPLPNSPFTAMVSAEWQRRLDDGATVTVKNHRTIARDNSGRVFQERRYFTPDGDSRETFLQRTEIADPSSHQIYNCIPDERVCNIRDYFVPASPPPPLAPAGSVDGGTRFIERLDLGRDSIEGVEAVGTRETVTINRGVIGNDRPISVVREFWYSPQLGINLIEKRDDPRDGAMSFIVSRISLGEPNASLFETPAGYRVVDLRTSRDGAAQNSNNN
jgi:hypothetical protein